MKHRLAAMLAVAAMASGLVMFTPASPVQALNFCGGIGSATVPGGLTYPVTVTPTAQPAARTAGFTAALTAVCAGTSGTSLGLTASGTVSGWCGLSVGWGVASTGADVGYFSWVGVGGLLLLTGEVTMSVVAVPDVIVGHSCNSAAGASVFVIVGAGLLTNCSVSGIADAILATTTTVPGLSTTVTTNLPTINGSTLLATVKLCLGV